ncbi:MAG: type II 3-dehydroquinate dehydratase [Candidatus Dasytiphilus stammeri]
MKSKSHILLLNGPNLNLLGLRECDKYGTFSYNEIIKTIKVHAHTLHVFIDCFQSNSEYKLIERIHSAAQENNRVAYIIINPAAFTHTSIALRDALLAVKIPFIEVHISNIYARESFRKHSYFSDIACGIISGFGPYGYILALQAAVKHLHSSKDFPTK